MKQKLILLTVFLTTLSAFAIPSLSYYTLTVNSGSGGGSYTNTQVVEISADAPADGKAFDRWAGDAVCGQYYLHERYGNHARTRCLSDRDV